MPSERIAIAFRDILNAIALIEEWSAEANNSGTSQDWDEKTRSAIERQLLIISEAAVRINKLDPSAVSKLAPTIDWPGIRGIGNFIRHKYDDLDANIISNVVRNRLPVPREACIRAIAAPGTDKV